MNKIIWKDIDSSTIKGLLICELPPITKPKMRVQETEVDGVDGSIIEELGYESYDKSIKIGLTRDYDIDEVIKYFTGEGKLVLSNEPNKYYKAKIIEQIDYTRLLRFKEAEIKFRVQPFKYEYGEEETITETGSVEGAEVKITDAKATEIKIDGRSTQDGEPTPDTPVEIESVGYENLFDGEVESGNINSSGVNYNDTNSIRSKNYIKVQPNTTYTLSNNGVLFGVNISEYNSSKEFISRTYINATSITTSSTTEYIRFQVSTIEEPKFQLEKGSIVHPYIPYGKYGIEVKTTGKNLFNKENASVGYYINYNTGGFSKAEDGFTASDFIEVKPNAQYYCNFVAFASSNFGMAFYDEDKNYISGSRLYNSITTPDNAKYFRFCVRNEEYSSGTSITDINTVQLEEGSVATEYQPYQERITVIQLNAPLRSLPNGVKDIAYIKNDKLYVDRYIGSVVLNGSENWELQWSSSSEVIYGWRVVLENGITYPNNADTLNAISSDYFKNYTQNSLFANKGAGKSGICGRANTNMIIISYNDITSSNEFKVFLSNNNVQVDYELLTPVTEELGDLTILELVDGENNISNSADTNMIVDYVDNKLIINNLGNYVSKPTFEIEGAGTIKFILNGYSVFTYNFDEDGRVVIDSEKEDAYLGSVLKNRNMNGEFPKLEIGENIITWDGLVKNIKAVKKSRWL